MEIAEIILTILRYFVDILAAAGGIFASILACSKKVRGKFSSMIRDDDSIQKMSKEITTLSTKIDKVDKKVEDITKDTTHIKEKSELNDIATVLTLKYEILDICNRAKKYNGIVSSDKEILCELYHNYVEIWRQNHYVKSEALNVINNFKIIDSYSK